MFLVHVEDNNIYVVFRDLSDESRDISVAISRKLHEKNVPSSLHNRIKTFFHENAPLSDNLERQKTYVSTLRTYIDIVSRKHGREVYYLNLYILPKDVALKGADESLESIEKIEKLSLRIFQLYNEEIEKKDVEFLALKEFKGSSFLDLELSFYEKELQRLHDHLLNYRRTLHDRIVCSDKRVGVPVQELNMLEPNPLKEYQFVKVAHQQDLIMFVYSLIHFLQHERIAGFKSHRLYKKLQTITSKIYNFLHKISTTHHLRYEQIKPRDLQRFFMRFKNSPEIQKNRLIYDILEYIFSNQLRDGAFLSKAIDMTKMFETVVEKRLRTSYGDRLFVGDESRQKIRGKEPQSSYLNEINYLLKEDDKPLIRQYPDYLIEDEDYGIYHVLDAKYKLLSTLKRDRQAFWQILIYARLFNKKETQDLSKMQRIKKMIFYADVYEIDLEKFEPNLLRIDTESINFNDSEKYRENVFDSTIKLVGISIFTST
jgi:hypothetical protein